MDSLLLRLGSTALNAVSTYALSHRPCAACKSLFVQPDVNSILGGRYEELPDSYVGKSAPTPEISLERRTTFRALERSKDRGCPLCQILFNFHDECRKYGESAHNIYLETEELVFYFQRSNERESALVLTMAGYGNHLLKILEMYTTSDNPVATYIPGRPTNLDIGARESLQAGRAWLHNCDTDHDSCPKLLNCPLPNRILYIPPRDGSENPVVWLHLSDGQQSPYAALSYCWGGSQPVKTTQVTLLTHQNGIKISLLPRSIQDAIFCTQELGLSYLWVDSLCIVQDSDENKAKEISMMGEIYQNAYITIQAASASSCHEGFLQRRERRSSAFSLPYVCSADQGLEIPYWEREDAITQIVTGNVFLSLTNDINDPRVQIEPINKRAWAFQEALLSSRTLIFSQIQLFFRCDGGFKADGGQLKWEDYGAFNRITALDGAYRKKVESPDSVHSPGTKILKIKPDWFKALKDWEDLIEDYTKRKLTDPRDKLPAFSAIASCFQAALNDDLLAGCWRTRLIQGLTWTSGSSHEPTTRPLAWRAPTWSWFSVDGYVTFVKPEGHT